MRNGRGLVGLFALLSLLAGGFAYGEDEPGQRPAVGEEAPPITASTWLNTEGGVNPTKDVEGKVILVEFWGT